jgi:hypothetical protein
MYYYYCCPVFENDCFICLSGFLHSFEPMLGKGSSSEVHFQPMVLVLRQAGNLISITLTLVKIGSQCWGHLATQKQLCLRSCGGTT